MVKGSRECEIYYTRHCNTISNIFQEFKSYLKGKGIGKGKPIYRSIENPSLSNLGILHALRIVDKYHLDKKVKPHFVCGSYYVRTWETAFILYNSYFKAGGALYILPYIHEYNDDLDGNGVIPDHVYQREYKYYNVKKCLIDFMKFIDYLKGMVHQHYPHLIEKNIFTFNFPKIIFMDKNGNQVTQKDAMDLEFYKKHIYLYSPDWRIFESRIFPKFQQDVVIPTLQLYGSDPSISARIAIIIHGKLIKTDLLRILYRRDQEGKVIGASLPREVDIVRKIDDKGYLLINNCDTFVKRYRVQGVQKMIYEKGVRQLFPNSQREANFYDHFYVKPLGKVELDTRMIRKRVEKKVVITQEMVKMILGIYYREKYIKRFRRYLEWMQRSITAAAVKSNGKSKITSKTKLKSKMKSTSKK